MIITHLQNLISYKQNLLSFAKRYRPIAIGVILGLSLFYLFKSCSLNHLPKDHYVIGEDTRWRELHLRGKERNLSAFNHELLSAIGKQEHFRIRLAITFNLVKELEQGKLQGILTTLQPSYLNEHLLFSEPYFLTGPVLILPAQIPIQELNGSNKKTIAIPENSPLLSSLEQDPSIQIRIYDDILPALADLRERRIDGAIFPAILAHTYIKTFYKHELKIATFPLTGDGIRLATVKNEVGESLIKKFNDGLEALKQNGTYHDMQERWGLIDVEHILSDSLHN